MGRYNPLTSPRPACALAEVYSGNGYERNQNGAAGSTSWAQPSGLSLSPDGSELFVADSESSTVSTVVTSRGGMQRCLRRRRAALVGSPGVTYVPGLCDWLQVRRLSLVDGSSSACVGGDAMFADNLFRCVGGGVWEAGCEEKGLEAWAAPLAWSPSCQ